MGEIKRFLERSLERTGTRFLLGHDFRKTMLRALSPMPERNDKGLAVFSIVANEMFFLPAWLDHHRRLGVEHFYILVDRSEDGTMEFLGSQVDVTTMTSEYGYGSAINISPLSKLCHKRFTRAGTLYKRVITDYLFEGQWALYLDVDEFLLMPTGFDKITQLIDEIDGKTAVIPASNVIFFPEKISEIAFRSPKSFDDLVQQAPWFDATPLLDVIPGKGPMVIGQVKTEKLYWDFLGEKSGSTYKSPLMKHSKWNFRQGSHKTSIAPKTAHCLSVGHFVFTENTASKIESAKLWRSYYKQSEEYLRLERLIFILEQGRHSLLDSTSLKFTSNSQLMRAGLMCWPGA